MRDIVNEDDEVLGRADKSEFGAGGHICRVAFIMLANAKGELLLHQRSANKRSYPLYWSGAAAGHLDAGESYEEAAIREMREEIGVSADLEFVGKFYSEADREMVGVFLGHYDGPIEVEPNEVAQVVYFTPRQLEQRPTEMRITSYVERSLPLVLERLS
ncbi:NUDIX hydrolase [Pedococcus bigeumensis]|uniref:NUDIX domain-containing protein n=1 Tax=Pedococcus bigeumensis TaxID=433644 RepID=A0A502CXA8_9MICO|nr:NUDIX domain-containing protein [Pedococcus bigeumensis]TPG17170.1 NUDIX domain-containing protein [Pedococcus bigeumensis]